MISRIASFFPSLRWPREELFRGSIPRALIAILAVPRSAPFDMGFIWALDPVSPDPTLCDAAKDHAVFPIFVSFTVARVDYTPGKVLKLRISPASRQRESKS